MSKEYMDEYVRCHEDWSDRLTVLSLGSVPIGSNFFCAHQFRHAFYAHVGLPTLYQVTSPTEYMVYDDVDKFCPPCEIVSRRSPVYLADAFGLPVWKVIANQVEIGD